MLSRLYVVLTLVILAIIGAIRLLAKLSELRKRDAFSNAFLKHLVKYVDSGGSDAECYAWLVYNSVQMQSYMGSLGIVDYKPSGANYMFSGYPVVVNILPEMRTAFQTDITRYFADQHAQLLHESIMRYMGALNISRERLSKELKNPFAMAREGIRTVLMMPVYLLHWVGLINRVGSFENSFLIRWLTALVTLLTVASALVSLVVGWDEFIRIVMEFFKRYR